MTDTEILKDSIMDLNLILESNIYTHNNMTYLQFIEQTAHDDVCCLISYDGVVNIESDENNATQAFKNVFSIYFKFKEIDEILIETLLIAFNQCKKIPLINSLSIDNGIIAIGLTI